MSVIRMPGARSAPNSDPARSAPTTDPARSAADRGDARSAPIAADARGAADARIPPDLAQGGPVAGMLLGRGAGLLLGWHTGRLPRRGRIAPPGQAPGAYRLTAWPRAEGGCWFLAALQVPGGLAPGAGVLEMLAGDLPPRRLTAWAADTLDPAGLAQALAARATSHAGAIALFLADLAAAAAPAAAAPLRAVLEAFCAAAAEEDGATEVLGAAPGLLLLQGWGDEAALEGLEALLPAASRRLPAQALRFDRPDIGAPATGLVQLVESPGDIRLEDLVFVAGTRLRRRRLVDRPLRLDPAPPARRPAGRRRSRAARRPARRSAGRRRSPAPHRAAPPGPSAAAGRRRSRRAPAPPARPGAAPGPAASR